MPELYKFSNLVDKRKTWLSLLKKRKKKHIFTQVGLWVINVFICEILTFLQTVRVSYKNPCLILQICDRNLTDRELRSDVIPVSALEISNALSHLCVRRGKAGDYSTNIQHELPNESYARQYHFFFFLTW